MKILAFDTSTKYLSIACLENDIVRAELHEEMGIKHSEMLLIKIRKVLSDVKWGIKDIDLVCVGIGPGSFTGLRIGVATCKGFAAAIGMKVLGIPSIDAVALRASNKAKRVAPVLDARKGKIYSSIYERKDEGIERVSDHLLVTAEEFVNGLDQKTFIFGDGLDQYKDILIKSDLVDYCEKVDWYPKATDIGVLGYNIYNRRKSADDPEGLDPMYLHSSECNITKKKKGKV